MVASLLLLEMMERYGSGGHVGSKGPFRLISTVQSVNTMKIY